MGKEGTRNFLKLFSSSILVQGIALLLSPIYARLFTPADFGLAALYLGIFSVLSVLGTAKYEQAIMLAHNDKAARSLFWLVQIISVCFALLVLVVVIFGGDFFVSLSGNHQLKLWLWFLPVNLLVYGLFQAANFYANRNKQFGLIAQSSLTQHASLNLSRLFAGMQGIAFNGLLASHILGQITGAFYMLIRNGKNLITKDGSISAHSIKEQARLFSVYPRYNTLLNITNNLSGALPIFIFTRSFSVEAAGLYAFGFTLVFRPIGLLTQSISQVLSQQIISDYKTGKNILPPLKKLVTKLFWLGIGPFSLLAVLAPWMFNLVFTQQYAMAGTFIQILSPWLFLVYLTSSLSFIPELFFKQKKAMIIDLIYLGLRFGALAAGVWQQNLWLAAGLFGAVSFGVVAFNLFWYLSLARRPHKTKNNLVSH